MNNNVRNFSGSLSGFHLRLVEFFHSHTVNNSSKRPGPLCLQTATQPHMTPTTTSLCTATEELEDFSMKNLAPPSCQSAH